MINQAVTDRLRDSGYEVVHNLDRYDETGKVDWYYLQGLSDDAVPVLATLPDDVCVNR
ncbi:MAG: Sensor histidine kinase BaeS [Nocardioides sp.]|nr:Sensor histidine kinase BaeS [Nocardioides sp.]